MIQPATSGIAIPDPRAGKIKGWLAAQITFQCLTLVGALATLVLWPITMSSRDFAPVLIVLAVWTLVAIAGFVCAMVALGYQTATRDDLTDALTRYGHHSVPAKKLLSNKRPLVPSPIAGLWLLVGIQREESGRTSLVAFAVMGVVVALGVISIVGFARAEHESQSTTTGRVMGIVGGAILALVAFPAVYATLALAALAFTIG
jgi:hypothetical protein